MTAGDIAGWVVVLIGGAFAVLCIMACAVPFQKSPIDPERRRMVLEKWDAEVDEKVRAAEEKWRKASSK